LAKLSFGDNMKKLILFLISSLFLFGAEKTVTISIEGMTCPLCTMAIKKSLKRIEGVKKAKVRLNTEKATVVFDDTKVDEEELLKAIKKVGYKGIIESMKGE